MRHPAGETAFEDLTARARIRDAAIRLFAERGAESTTVRDIAQAAGVSPGLLRHHFGSKDELREACDAYVLERIMKIKEKLVYEGGVATPGYLPSVHPTIVLYYKYLTRALLGGSSSAAAMFDDIVVLTEEWISKNAPDVTDDYRGYAALMVGMHTGMLAMFEHMNRALGVDIFTAPGHTRLVGVMVDFYSHPLIDAEFLAQAHQAVDALRAVNPPTADEGA
ncbi:TetR/AcrR family transcriptional regulator [Dactylosporangium sp. CA-233914]|uniref:TetR/AcrR family transcriptional regulator n=1 Tax=Dactylosporangium sp. CA-233914 TaxID=3239934 RepID=UPI003D90BE36